MLKQFQWLKAPEKEKRKLKNRKHTRRGTEGHHAMTMHKSNQEHSISKKNTQNKGKKKKKKT